VLRPGKDVTLRGKSCGKGRPIPGGTRDPHRFVTHVGANQVVGQSQRN
jgi:hypothetical protein